MVRRPFLLVGLVTVAVLAAMTAASLSAGPLLGEHRSAGPDGPPPTHVRRPPTSSGRDSSGLPTWLVVSMTVLLGLYVLSLLVLVVLHRRRDDEDDDPERAWDDELEEVPTWHTVLGVDLGQAAEAQLAALQEGSPRNAIVASWLALQDATAGAGLPGVASETPEEYVLRALRSLRQLDPPAITGLAALYREARFSRHEMTEHHREQAGRALRVLAGQLAVYRAGTAPDLRPDDPADQRGERPTGGGEPRVLPSMSR